MLQGTGATLLFADTHTLRALPPHSGAGLALRSGVCKVGSGTDFLHGVESVPSKDGPPLRLAYAGVSLLAMGKQA